jgi:hypothetical protein
MPFVSRPSKAKVSDKKKADKIYSKLLHYAIYGTMVLGLAVVVAISIQPESHDTRSRASSNPYVSPMTLISENQSFGTHCYTVNDSHLRTWRGKLEANDTFTVDLPFCTDASIQNLAFMVTTQRDTPYSLSAVSPNGEIIYPPAPQELQKILCVTPKQQELERGKWQILLTARENETEESDITVVVAPVNSPELGGCNQ